MTLTCTFQTIVDNPKVRVTRFEFRPGDETGWHRHEHDYVITTLTRCVMKLEHEDGTTTVSDLQPGTVYYRDAGIRHNVINGGDSNMSFVEVELLSEKASV